MSILRIVVLFRVTNLIKIIQNILEYPYIHIIDKLLLEENINVYKCNKISNINLRYQNILPE